MPHECIDDLPVDLAQKVPQPPEGETKVVADGAEQDVDPGVQQSLQIIVVELSLGFHVVERPSQFPLDLAVHAAVLGGSEHQDRPTAPIRGES